MNPDNEAAGPSGNSAPQEGHPSRIERLSQRYLDSLEAPLRAKILELRDRNLLDLNSEYLPARHGLGDEVRDLEDLFRGFLANAPPGPVKDLSEAKLADFMRQLRPPAQVSSDRCYVPAPTSFGTEDLSAKDLDIVRKFRSDARGQMDIKEMLLWYSDFHRVKNGGRFSEKSLAENLMVLVPDNLVAGLAQKVRRGYSLERLFNDLCMASSDLLSEDDFRNQIDRLLDNPKNPLAAIKEVLNLTSNCPSPSEALGAEMLRECRKMIKRICPSMLFNIIENRFNLERVPDLISYYEVLRRNFQDDLLEAAKGKLKKIHHLAEASDLQEEEGGHQRADEASRRTEQAMAQVLQDVNALKVEVKEGISNQLEAKLKDLHLVEILDKISLVHNVAPSAPPAPIHPPTQPIPPGVAASRAFGVTGGPLPATWVPQQQPHGNNNYGQRPKKPRSRKSGKRYLPYSERICFLHASNSHTNGSCSRQLAVACPRHPLAHAAGACNRTDKGYIHIPGLKIYATDNLLAQQAALEAGQPIQPSQGGYGGQPNVRQPLYYPQVAPLPTQLTAQAPLALAGPQMAPEIPAHHLQSLEPASGVPSEKPQLEGLAQQLANLSAVAKALHN